MEKIIDRLKKIKELAERGVQGEAQAAKLLLEKLLKQHNITIEELSDEKREECSFNADNRTLAVLFMCLVNQIGVKRAKELYQYKRDKKYYIELTLLEYIEIKQLFNFHKKQYKKEFEKMKMNLERAYQHKHDLEPIRDDDSEKGESTMTLDDLNAMINIVRNLEDVCYRKQIEG
jgi:hypothetical protein